MSIETTVSARALANRKARREADANRKATKILAKAISVDVEDFTLDSRGRRVRVSRPMYDEVRSFLLRKRVIDTVETLEEMGELCFNALVQMGYVVKDANARRGASSCKYWITAKARDHYKLPAKIHLTSGYFADYVEA
jgi:hypothetical protein